jgi:hypothetical protein
MARRADRPCDVRRHGQVIMGFPAAPVLDVATGTRIGPPLTATPDDQLLMSLAMDGTTLAYGGGLHSGIKVVDLDPDAGIDASCAIAGRNLTAEEWATYIGDLAEYTPTCPRFPSCGRRGRPGSAWIAARRVQELPALVIGEAAGEPRLGDADELRPVELPDADGPIDTGGGEP